MLLLDWPIHILLPGLAAAALFSFYTIRRKSLSPDGALAASVVGLWVLLFAGAKWLLPLFFFFAGSTLLGRLAKRRSIVSDAKHGKARDYRQVLCNGGVYAALATFLSTGSDNWPYVLMAVSMAVSTADTWSSEIGMYCRGRTFDILLGKAVPVGLSGGVSIEGSAGGLAGAFCIAVLCSFLMHGFFVPLLVAGVTGAGFTGMVLDSVLGAGLQARYRDPSTGVLSDIASPQAVLYSGKPLMSNDGVNLFSNIVITAAAFVSLHLFSV